MPDHLELSCWARRLEAVTTRADAVIRRIVVASETDSTQDSARRLNLQPGEGITAGMQTRGRGRRGREWVGAPHAGIALTLVYAAEATCRLAVAVAVGAATALESVVRMNTARASRGEGPVHIGIKWPNDLVLRVEGDARGAHGCDATRWKKVGGILIEQSAGCAYVGIGINVHTQAWEPALAETAVSLADAGVCVERIDVLEALLRHIDAAWRMQPPELVNAFNLRNALSGERTAFESNGRLVEGVVTTIDPLRGIALHTDAGTCWLDANVTTRIE